MTRLFKHCIASLSEIFDNAGCMDSCTFAMAIKSLNWYFSMYDKNETSAMWR